MNENDRPDPESILSSIKKDEEKSRHGKLKIFFGMSAGVGKTYAMLKAAHKLKDEGSDIIAGYIETHNRAETAELVNGLELIPRKSIVHNGLSVDEFDIDAVLKRKPGIVLVDELAHTNAAGSRHNKRYQDVMELLDNGINVYTTLNVQHIESQADVVEQITGIKIREKISDSILDRADSIELIDIPPEGLLKRLSEGKVYIPEKAGLAADRFFRKGNITALREMALNYVAKSVDNDLQHYMEKKNIQGPWKAGNRLMVAVSPSPYSEYLIRWTRRMAFSMKATWVALYIERQGQLSEPEQRILKNNLNLARELGAEVISTIDEKIPSGLMRIARQKNISQIIVGKPLKKYFSDIISGGNLIQQLLKISGDVEIHIVSQPQIYPDKLFNSGIFKFNTGLREYLFSFASVGFITLLSFLIVPFTGYWTISLIYLLNILIISLFIGRGSVFFAAIASSIVWNFLFIPPYYTLRINRIEDLMMFLMYFITATIVGELTSRLRAKEWALRIREKKIIEMYEFSKALENSSGIDEVTDATIKYIEKYLNSKTAILLCDDTGKLSAYEHKKSSFKITESGRGVAEWVFKNKKPAGQFTVTLPQADGQYLPLNAAGGIAGVLCIRPDSKKEFTDEQVNLIQHITYQLALRLDRERLNLDSQKAILTAESEKIYKILLNSISHELRTPLTTITGASSSLMDEIVSSKPETRSALISEINKAGSRLNRLVDNLLDMSRLESGKMKLNLQRHDPADLISSVLHNLDSELSGYKVMIDNPDEMKMINIDFVLMEQALINLVYNAVNHTLPGTEIRISTEFSGNYINISVKDNGPGLNSEDIPFIFDKFQRGLSSSPGGTGLGLSICKGIVESHNGKITAENNKNGGANFTIMLPLDEQEIIKNV